MVQTAKHWSWTLNNYTPDEEERIQDAGGASEVTYLIYGREVSESNTPHLQGYIVFGRRRSLQFAKSLLGQRLHLEVSRGTPEQNIEYCSKDGDTHEAGSRPSGQGSRSDLRACYEKVKSSGSLREVADAFPRQFIRYHAGITKLHSFYKRKRTWQTEVYVFWGPTGTGKTKRAFEEAGDGAFIYPGGGWFDGYDGEENVIFDEFSGGEFKLTYLLRILDRYPMKVPVKGSFIEWIPKKIWITSNLDPNDWYPSAHQEHKDALRRRFTQVTHFNQPLQ
jgi:hypothetical protein